MKPKLIISDMYRAKNKISFFAIHQALNKLSDFDIEFHILWDDPTYEDEWTDKINKLDANIISYTKHQLNDYCLSQGISLERVNSFNNFKSIYFVIHGHYLRRNNITDYYLIYDDDIVLKDDLTELKDCLRNKVPCLLSETMNANCDKSLINKLFSLYENAAEYYLSINPECLGFNAGFQGMSLEMYDDFIDSEGFNFLLDLFDYSGIYDENGKEITGEKRSLIDTQQQSFFSVMNIIRSTKKPHILNPKEYYICPNWGRHPIYGDIDTGNEYNGWDINMKSKIVHFIGHTVFDGVYYGKPKIYHQIVNEYLKENNIS